MPKKIVEKAVAMTDADLNWKPLYPNNMPQNGLDGYYCVILNSADSEGIMSGRKYSIVFQHEEVEPGTGHIDSNKIDRYVLFEKCYFNIKGRWEHPDPSETVAIIFGDDENTFNAAEVNDYGRFVYAYKDIESAKKRALRQYKAIYGYAMSFIL